MNTVFEFAFISLHLSISSPQKITLIPDKGFQNTEILNQAVIAQSVEPRQIFVSISINERFKTEEGSNPTRLIFFREGDIFKYHYCSNKTFYHIFVIF